MFVPSSTIHVKRGLNTEESYTRSLRKCLVNAKKPTHPTKVIHTHQQPSLLHKICYWFHFCVTVFEKMTLGKWYNNYSLPMNEASNYTKYHCSCWCKITKVNRLSTCIILEIFLWQTKLHHRSVWLISFWEITTITWYSVPELFKYNSMPMQDTCCIPRSVISWEQRQREISRQLTLSGA